MMNDNFIWLIASIGRYCSIWEYENNTLTLIQEAKEKI